MRFTPQLQDAILGEALNCGLTCAMVSHKINCETESLRQASFLSKRSHHTDDFTDIFFQCDGKPFGCAIFECWWCCFRLLHNHQREIAFCFAWVDRKWRVFCRSSRGPRAGLSNRNILEPGRVDCAANRHQHFGDSPISREEITNESATILSRSARVVCAKMLILGFQ